MNVKIQRGSPALNTCYRAAGTVRRPANPRPFSQVTEDLRHENPPRCRLKFRIARQNVSDHARHAEHPLADRHARDHPIHQMRGDVGHSPARARRAQPALFGRTRRPYRIRSRDIALGRSLWPECRSPRICERRYTRIWAAFAFRRPARRPARGIHQDDPGPLGGGSTLPASGGGRP